MIPCYDLCEISAPADAAVLALQTFVKTPDKICTNWAERNVIQKIPSDFMWMQQDWKLSKDDKTRRIRGS